MEELNNNKRKTTAMVYTEPYNPDRIDRLKNIVADFYKQGKKKRYSILVDGEMIVSINCDSRNFDNYKNYIEAHTKSIEVRMYFASSHNCNRYLFHTEQASLSGVDAKDVKEQIAEALEKQRIETKLRMLKEKIEQKDKKIEEYEEILAELDDKQIDIKELLKEGMELYGKYNANKNGNPSISGTPETQVEVEIESDNSISSTNAETESDKFYQKMKNKYNQESLDGSLKMWSVWLKYPELKREFMKLVKTRLSADRQKIKEDGEA